jgi:hypothetical protein
MYLRKKPGIKTSATEQVDRWMTLIRICRNPMQRLGPVV